MNKFLEFHVAIGVHKGISASSKKDLMKVTHEKPSYMLKNECWLISGVEICGGRGPLGPPGSSAYVIQLYIGI